MDTLWLIVVVMFLSGALGGLINSFMGDPNRSQRLPIWQHVVIGIGAAFIIPLFLNSISANLIDDIIGSAGKPGNNSKLLVLIGFCVLAAIVSRSFINSISNKIFAELQETRQDALAARSQAGEAETKAEEAKQSASRTQKIVAPFVEEDGLSSAQLESSNQSGQDLELTTDEKSILDAMINSSYAMRSLTGLATDTGLDRSKINSSIASMVQRQLIAQGESSSGQPRWYATTIGRSRIAQPRRAN